MNVLLFNGRRLVREQELENVTPRSVYKADGGRHEQERGVRGGCAGGADLRRFIFDELFKLFTVMTGDPRFEETANEVRREGGYSCSRTEETLYEQRGKKGDWTWESG